MGCLWGIETQYTRRNMSHTGISHHLYDVKNSLPAAFSFFLVFVLGLCFSFPLPLFDCHQERRGEKDRGVRSCGNTDRESKRKILCGFSAEKIECEDDQENRECDDGDDHDSPPNPYGEVPERYP